MAKDWRQTNEGRLNRLKTIGQRCGWSLKCINDTHIRMIKEADQNMCVDIDGQIEFMYKISDHSVTTILRHKGELKTLKRWIKPGMWKPIEDVLKYPRVHIGQNTNKFKYKK